MSKGKSEKEARRAYTYCPTCRADISSNCPHLNLSPRQRRRWAARERQRRETRWRLQGRGDGKANETGEENRQ